MLQEMERRADRAAAILAGMYASGEVNVYREHDRAQAVKAAVLIAAAIEAETVQSFNEGMKS